LTSHSPSILSSLPDKARIFIEKVSDGNFKSIASISVNAALSKMDSLSYPLVDLFCEDDQAKKIIQKAISSIQSEMSLTNFSDLINIVVSGSGSKTFTYFKSHQETYPNKRIKTGYACILDGDRRLIKDANGNLSYPEEDCLHFIYSNDCPEKFLVAEYLKKHPNSTLSYHLNNANPHCLFDKMIENSVCTTTDEAFDKCWNHFITTTSGGLYFEELKSFIIKMTKKYSPDL